MLGRNHATYAAASWAAAWPLFGYLPPAVGEINTSDLSLFVLTTGIAAGAGVVPDLDHPDSRPSQHFGIISHLFAKGVNQISGGHRHGTHSLVFAALAGIVFWLIGRLPTTFGIWIAVIACGFCCSVGVALVGPSLGFKIPTLIVAATAVVPGWFVYTEFERIAPCLWILAAGGVLVHICCDAVTKGGIPFFWPFKKGWYGLGLFAVGGKGESIASVIGIAALGWYLYRSTTIIFNLSTV